MFKDKIDAVKLMLHNIESYDGYIRRTAMQRAEREFYLACDLADTDEEWAVLSECMETLNKHKERGCQYV